MRLEITGSRIAEAREILRENDRGSYTVPTKGLYPFQWNWDSCLTALGLSRLDEARAFTEIDTLFDHQWDDGMVPHIVFHENDDGYFPGADVWRTGRRTPTSGITQPPVAGFVLNRLVRRAADRPAAEARARALLPKIAAWHDWFFRCRDPEGTGLVTILHPWESGRDNSVDWDTALARVPTEHVEPFTRRDTQHANPEHRPTEDQYVRFISLVQTFRDLDWDNTRLHEASPFQMVDPGFNAILIRSCAELAELADRLDASDIAARSREFAKRGLSALDKLWSAERQQYLCYDRRAGRRVDSLSIGGLLAVFAPVPTERAKAVARRIEHLATRARFLVPSHDPGAQAYDSKRYWRGPLWLVVNYMIADGLRAAGIGSTADRIQQDSLNLIEQSGFAEYYDPQTGMPCGGGRFTWTAAMVIEFLNYTREAA